MSIGDQAAVGDTPLVQIDGVFAKLECVNPCGSIKDRIAHFILTESRRAGTLVPGQRIVEATSGNTGIAVAYYGRLMGHPVTIVMPEHMTEERKRLITGLGAELVLCSEQGSFAEAATIRDQFAAETGAFNVDQFANQLNTECHRTTTGQELLRQLEGRLEDPVAFVAGVGTGGTLIGVGSALKDAKVQATIVAVEPEEAAVMTHGRNESHGIFGIGDGFVPAIASDGEGGLHPMISSVEVVSTHEASDAAKLLATKHGLCVGVSSGANFVAAKRLLERFRTVVTVFADGHQKYHTVGLAADPGARCAFSEICAQNAINGLLDQLDRPASA